MTTVTVTSTPFQVSVDDAGTSVTVAATGPAGPAGQGVPAGGSTGQVLKKASGTNYDTEWGAAGSGSGDLLAANNLSDLANAGTARTNLGLGTAATAATGDFAATTHTHSATQITSGTLAVGRGGTGVTSVPMISVVTAADASAARTVLGLGTAAVAATGTGSSDVILGNDSRLTDARTPVAHSADLVTSGTLGVARVPDLTLSKISDSGGAAALNVGSSAGTVCAGDDSRLSDARTPTSHNHAASEITSGTLAVARGGTGSATAPMVGVITAADAAAARTVLGVSAGGGTDYTMAPITSTWRFFDDMLQVTPDSGAVDGNNQFWMMQGGSGITPGEAIYSDGRGVVQMTLGGSNRRHTYWGGFILNGVNEADGDELVWESRFLFVDSTATSGSVQLGVVDRINTLNKGDAAPGNGYSSFDFAAIVIDLAETNLVLSHKDTGGAATPTKVDLGSSFPVSSYVDTFVRFAVHAKYNNTDSDWDVDFYINGTKVGSTISMTFSDGLVPYVGTSVGTHSGNANLNMDWISYQGKIGSQISGRTTLIDIDDV